MPDKDRKLLQVSLAEAIEAWFGEATNRMSYDFPYVGVNATSLMADAAFAVLMGITDAQNYLEAEGMLKGD